MPRLTPVGMLQLTARTYQPDEALRDPLDLTPAENVTWTPAQGCSIPAPAPAEYLSDIGAWMQEHDLKQFGRHTTKSATIGRKWAGRFTIILAKGA
jgi:hypothetical protein